MTTPTLQHISLGPTIQCNLAFSPNGNMLYYANKQAVAFVSLEQSTIVSLLDCKQTVRSLESISDNELLIGTERGEVYLYTIQTDVKKTLYKAQELPIISLKFLGGLILIVTPMKLALINPNGDVIQEISSEILIETATLIYTDNKPTIIYSLTDAAGSVILQTQNGPVKISGNKTWVTCIDQSSDGKRLFFGSDNGRVYVYHYPNMVVESVIPVSDLRISGVIAVGEKCFIASAIDCSIQIIQLTELWLTTLRLGGVGEERYIRFRYSDSSRTLVAVSNLQHLHSWTLDSNMTTPTTNVLPTGHSDATNSVYLYQLPTIPQSISLVTSSLDSTVRVYVKTANRVRGPTSKYREIARPLVHGYPLSRAVMVDKPLRLLIASHEEKPIRILEASKYFIESMRYVTHSTLSEDDLAYYETSPIGANHQPLSLTNCPLRDRTGSSRQSQVQSPTKQIPNELLLGEDAGLFDDIVVASVPKVYMTSPPEEELHYHTLWPETNKLLQHQSEVMHMLVSKDEQFVLTSGLYLKPSQFTTTIVPPLTCYLWQKDGEVYKVVEETCPFGEEDEIVDIVYHKDYYAVAGREGTVMVAVGEGNKHLYHKIAVSEDKITAMCNVENILVIATVGGQLYQIDTTTLERSYGIFLNKNVSAMKGIKNKIIIGYVDGSVDVISVNGEGIHLNKKSSGLVNCCCPTKILTIDAILNDTIATVALGDDIGSIIIFELEIN
ncbi:Elongator complex protein 2 [Entamoeba marina]